MELMLISSVVDEIHVPWWLCEFPASLITAHDLRSSKYSQNPKASDSSQAFAHSCSCAMAPSSMQSRGDAHPCRELQVQFPHQPG